MLRLRAASQTSESLTHSLSAVCRVRIEAPLRRHAHAYGRTDARAHEPCVRPARGHTRAHAPHGAHASRGHSSANGAVPPRPDRS
eukprot:2175757-Prymnesium_polylepis.1